jgi:hypothetical protein
MPQGRQTASQTASVPISCELKWIADRQFSGVPIAMKLPTVAAMKIATGKGVCLRCSEVNGQNVDLQSTIYEFVRELMNPATAQVEKYNGDAASRVDRDAKHHRGCR